MKIIAIGAHPDDYELGAAMRLIYHVRMKDDVIGIICSNGERAGDMDTRIREAMTAAELIGMKEVHLLGFPDTKLPSVEIIKDSLEEIISTINPAIVYSHYPDDRHQDHRAVAMATSTACRKVPSILTYRSPSTMFTSFQPHLFHVGVPSDFEKKRELLQIYQSQINREYGISLDQALIDSKFYGTIVSRYSRDAIYAEPFCANHFVLNCREL
jgi:LmbE family N-acetylglucosaminyl deacetylase